MTKILALVASRRKYGNSHVLALEAMAGAKSAGSDVELLNISDLQIDFCEGCLRCVFTGKCSGKDDMGLLLAKILEADGLIVSAPVYLLSPASVIKKLLDRALVIALYADELSERLRGALTISVAGKEDWSPLGPEILNQFALAYGFTVYNYLEAFAPGPGEILLQDEVVTQANTLGHGLVEYVLGKAQPRTPDPGQCPVCYSRSFRFLGGRNVQCPICLIKGELEESGIIRITSDLKKDSFWEPGHRKRHLEEWIKVTRVTYLKNRALIKDKQKKYLPENNIY
ncbi:MAG: flavodoxin family protein [Dethiobacter sp.]|jgi:multimeric flavodoxin WrbA|nr:flavodoxin family protein [Dethiobacter sp.]